MSETGKWTIYGKVVEVTSVGFRLSMSPIASGEPSIAPVDDTGFVLIGCEHADVLRAYGAVFWTDNAVRITIEVVGGRK